MKKSEAIELALNLVCLIKQGTCQLREKLWVWEGSNDIPHIYQFLIFGSVAKREDDEKVDDLDMVIIDNSFFSRHFECNGKFDWYSDIQDNARILLSDFLFQNEELGDVAHEIMDSNIDLHLLPQRFFRDKKYRQEVADKHWDPDFFRNCFDTMLRLKGVEFVPVDVHYFEKKYHCNLRDLY